MSEIARKWTPYQYCYNNPLRFIDPDGMVVDDYFNQDGEYLGSDDAETDNVKVMDQATWDMNKTVNEDGSESIVHEVGEAASINHSEANLSEEATLKVYDHYNPTDLDVVAHDHENGNGGLTLSTDMRTGKQKIKVKIQGNIDTKMADHANEIENAFVHEERHYDDSKANGLQKHSATPKSVREQRAVAAQMSHSTFSKTRPKFQKAVKAYGAKYGLLSPLTPLPAMVTTN